MKHAVDSTVANLLRWFLPETVFEVVARTIQGRFLLLPSERGREIVLGVVGRALERYPAVSLYGFVFLSNHTHLLVSSAHGGQLAKFLGYVFGNVARKIGRIHDWKGKFWAKRCRPIPVVDDLAVISRLRYVLSQSVKEGIVERAEDWPGASCVPWFRGQPLTGTWVIRDREARALRSKKPVDPSTYTETYNIQLSPIPCWSRFSRSQIAVLVGGMLEGIAMEARQRRSSPVLGVEAALAIHPHETRDLPESGPAPLCHATRHETRKAYEDAYRAFVRAFRAASEAIKSGAAIVAFPLGSFPSASCFVEVPRSYVPPWRCAQLLAA